MRKLFPCRGMVFVKRDEPMERTAGGLFVPDTAEDKALTTEGVVLAVGSGWMRGKEEQPQEVDVGDRVVFGKYAGNRQNATAKIDGESILMLRGEDVLAVWRED